jgi:hypothetical protein
MNNWKIIYEPSIELIKQAIDLDRLVYKNPVDVGDIDKCKSWIKKNNQIYTFLLNEDKLIGYINFMPVTETCYEDFKQGIIRDSDISSKDIVKFSNESPNKCIFISIVIHPDYQNGLEIRLLLKGFFNKLKLLKTENFNISHIVADCVSNIGEKAAVKFLKAKLIKESSKSKIYEAIL